LAPPERNPHGAYIEQHPVCAWQLWAFTSVFRWPQAKPVPALEDWIWGGCYRARRAGNQLPGLRFRPVAPEFKPAVLEEPPPTDEQERMRHNQALHFAVMEWVGSTVQKAWAIGGGRGAAVGAVASSSASAAAAAAAEAIAAAEEFGESTRHAGRPGAMEQGQQFVAGICELATRAAAKAQGGGAVPAVACAAATAVYEALVQATLTKRGFDPDLVGHIVLNGLRAAELSLGAGIASAIGERASEAYALLQSRGQPPQKRLGEELSKLVECACASVGADDGTQKAVAQAVIENLDLAMAAQDGLEASLRLAQKQEKAPKYYKNA